MLSRKAINIASLLLLIYMLYSGYRSQSLHTPNLNYLSGQKPLIKLTLDLDKKPQDRSFAERVIYFFYDKEIEAARAKQESEIGESCHGTSR